MQMNSPKNYIGKFSEIEDLFAVNNFTSCASILNQINPVNAWEYNLKRVYEIISLTHKLREMIRSETNTDDIIAEARNGDLITMKEDWILKAIKGYTTIEEILRVI